MKGHIWWYHVPNGSPDNGCTISNSCYKCEYCEMVITLDYGNMYKWLETCEGRYGI